MKIMVCIDGSDKSKMALEKTVDMFKPQKPYIYLVTVVEEPLDATSMDEVSFEKWKASRSAELREAAAWTAEHGLDVDAILAIGDPRKMIVEAVVNKNPDILVVARRGGGVLDNMVLGSVSAYLVRHAHCPVLVMN